MRRGSESGNRAAGFSLVEVLVATLLFFMIAMGIVPLFSRSTISNRAGADATTVSQFGLSRVEELSSPPLSSALVDPGTSEESYSDNDRIWKPGPPPDSGDLASWTRVTRITQHSLSDLDADGVLDDPLPEGAAESTIHLKLIEVRVGMVRDPKNPIGRRPDLDLRAIRPY
jgi:type II secretory pathway pseudopilin PulG